MKKIEYAVQMDKEKCKGDHLCADICPANAITMVDDKAVTDTERCVACFKCIDICPHSAVTSYERDVPRIAHVNPEEVDQDAIRELCGKAEVDPNEPVCFCTQTTAAEIAAAFIQGAKTPEDVTCMTGVRSGCLLYCTSALLRMCKANDPNFKARPPKFYDATQTAMDVPESVAEKYPLFGIKKEQEARMKLTGAHEQVSQENGGESC